MSPNLAFLASWRENILSARNEKAKSPKKSALREKTSKNGTKASGYCLSRS